MPPYTASLSQTQDRTGYSVIFRHPVRRDEATGKPGRRIRRGLGTRDAKEAERLRRELDTLLSDPQFHSVAAKTDAEKRGLDARIIDIFYDKMAPEAVDYAGLREERIPLPASGSTGYRRVLFLGTTGAGKTTLVRQLIGTDPLTERFPSTSTAKTTIHDTEIVIAHGDWHAAVTFASSEEVREYLCECVSAAVLAAARNATDPAVLQRLLNHVNQRFRFGYVLGNGAAQQDAVEDDEEVEEPAEDGALFSPEDLGEIDLEETNKLLTDTVKRLRKLAQRLSKQLREDLQARDGEDERVVEEIFEEELDNLVREDEEFQEIADALMDEIEKRFDLLPGGEVRKTKQGWPQSWYGTWPAEERTAFLKAIARFSSNYAPLFGRLLTPLVNGVRVAGPFVPSWAKQAPKLVLLDGEGLGHTPRSSSAVSTAVSRRMESTDAVILVDNATQPMQAAPLAAMREVIATGNARKLILAFTHFDEVKGDNLPNRAAKTQHVLASAENVLATFGEELGPFAERALRKRLEEGRFFLAGIDKALTPDSVAQRRTIEELGKLLEAVDRVIERPKPTKARPAYDRMNLVLAVRGAAEAFHEAWQPRLGLAHKPGISKEHWTRVKALSRRLATGMADEYDTLKPVADLRKELVERIYVFIQNPLRWEGPDPTDDERQQIFDSLADNLAKRAMKLATQRIWTEHTAEWQNAFDKSGKGSTFVRARIIASEIYVPAAPVPDVTPSPDRNQFLHEVVGEVDSAAKEVGAKLE